MRIQLLSSARIHRAVAESIWFAGKMVHVSEQKSRISRCWCRFSAASAAGWP